LGRGVLLLCMGRQSQSVFCTFHILSSEILIRQNRETGYRKFIFFHFYFFETTLCIMSWIIYNKLSEWSISIHKCFVLWFKLYAVLVKRIGKRRDDIWFVTITERLKVLIVSLSRWPKGVVPPFCFILTIKRHSVQRLFVDQINGVIYLDCFEVSYTTTINSSGELL